MNDKPVPSSKRTASFAEKVGAKATRKLEAQQSPPSVWMGLGMMGLIGWSVVVPTLLGAGLGLWLDARHTSEDSWTLALLVAGLVFGCVNVWRWIAREDQAMHQKRPDKDE